MRIERNLWHRDPWKAEQGKGIVNMDVLIVVAFCSLVLLGLLRAIFESRLDPSTPSKFFTYSTRVRIVVALIVSLATVTFFGLLLWITGDRSWKEYLTTTLLSGTVGSVIALLITTNVRSQKFALFILYGASSGALLGFLIACAIVLLALVVSMVLTPWDGPPLHGQFLPDSAVPGIIGCLIASPSK